MSGQNAEDVVPGMDPTDMEKWVRDLGSRRLMKAADAGLLDACHTLYRNERLHLERPGWAFLDETIRKQIKGIRNPSEENLDALLDARMEWPTVELVWVQAKYGTGEAWLTDDFLGRRIGISVADYRRHSDGGDV